METFRSVTVGQVSGLIAVGTAIVAVTVPLLIGVILLRYFDRNASAATWSVIAHQLQSSSWASILRTDSVAGKHVDWGVSAVAYLNICLALLTMLAGVVTPLGLGDRVATAGNQVVDFGYVPDLSSFGRSTQARADMPLSRDCVITAVSCPGAFVPGSVINQGEFNVSSNPNLTSTTKIPKNITTMFSSATENSTVAGIFDIQYRSWRRSTNEYYDEREPYVTGIYRHLEKLIHRENVTLVEGIIADMASGGIGFRNHTAPLGLSHGSSWDEDILWIEPEISCAGTNLSVEVTLGEKMSRFSNLEELELVDDGGFALLRHGDPYEGWPNITYSHPDVRLRADRTAWLNNVLLTLLFNLTEISNARYGANVTVGSHYPLVLNTTLADSIFPLGVQTELMNGELLMDLPDISLEKDGNLTHNGVKLYPPEEYSYKLASYFYRQLGRRCSGQFNDVSSEIDHNVECGYFLSPPSRANGGSPLEQEAWSKWNTPLYTCAGAVKASIKSVSFSTNGTMQLADLVATKIVDKHYADESGYPLWAMEDWWHPGSEGAYAAPLWGIVDDSFDGTEGYNFTRSAAFYLPYTHWSLTWDSSGTEAPLDSLAGPVAPYGVLAQVLHSIFDPILDDPRIPRYDGSDSLSLQTQLASLSETREGIERLLRLVWTDTMASATVGTNFRGNSSVLGGDHSSTSSSGVVTIYARQVTYDMKYAILAVIVLTMWVLLALAAFVVGLAHKHLPTHLKQMLNDTSVGRPIASATYPDTRAYLRSSTREWLDTVGHLKVQLGDSSGGAFSEHDTLQAAETFVGKNGRSPNEPLFSQEPCTQELHEPVT